jgi:anti-sigma regulatory factor (Ser/Thr protein kinase)
MATHHLTFAVPGTSRAVSDARRRVVATLRSWGLPSDSEVLDSVELATSELVTNAVNHAGAEPIAVRIRLRGEVLRVDVRDSSGRLPKPRPPAVTDENGRGLLIVAALASRYGVEATPVGKRCWAEFPVPTASRCPIPLA